jgi:proteasome assembly chaperone (PAC2) family protein
MNDQAFQIEELPQLNNPIFIIGFDGWGNALNISKGMVDYLVQNLKGQKIGRINTDLFYLYNQLRPVVKIEEGKLLELKLPGGDLFAVTSGSGGRDLLLMTADEPHIRWQLFVDEIFSLCKTLNVDTIITLGSFLDNILHTDYIISGYASSEHLRQQLQDNDVNFISYHGPSAIHTTIQSEGAKAGIQCMGIWCHSPYYMQGTTHLGILAHLGKLLSHFGDFELDVTELDEGWEKLAEKLQELIDNNPELGDLVTQLRKQKVRGTLEGMRETEEVNPKIINIEEFLKK